MQDRAELAWSKSVIVEVRKGDEGLFIHFPFKLSVLSAPQPKIRVQVQPRAEFARRLVLNHQLVYSSMLKERFRYICDTPPCGK
jgi:hypothetical protein